MRWYVIVIMSASEGLFAPAFCPLRMRNVSSGSTGWASQGGDMIAASIAFASSPASEGGSVLKGLEGEDSPLRSPLRGNTSERDGVG